MICLMIFIKSRVNKIFFSLWFAVITICHHQIPVNIFLYCILRHGKCILAFSNILNNACMRSCLFQYLPGSSIFILFPFFNGTFRQHPAFILIFIILVQKQYFTTKDYHTTTTCCFYHCNTS